MTNATVHFNAGGSEDEVNITGDNPTAETTPEASSADTGTADYGAVLDQGTAGANVTWAYCEDGTLVIAGSGEMTDLEFIPEDNGYTQPWKGYQDSITRVVVEEGVTNIAAGAFCDCSHIAEVFLPDSLAAINEEAFDSCSGLTSIDLPDGLASIGYAAFSHCSGLTSISLPDSLTDIDENPFLQCENLASIVVSPDHPALAVVDGALISKSDKTLVCCPCASARSEYTVPQGIEVIGLSAFDGCSSLASVTLPDSVTFIGDLAFQSCSGLTSIALPDGITRIGFGTFSGCSHLSSIVLPDSVTDIGMYAFAYCDNLADVYYGGTEAQWNAIAIGDDNDALKNATIIM